MYVCMCMEEVQFACLQVQSLWSSHRILGRGGGGGGGSTLYVKGLVAHLKTQKNTLKTYLSDLATQKIPQ